MWICQFSILGSLFLILFCTHSPRVAFCGYNIPHPADKKVNIRVQTRGTVLSHIILIFHLKIPVDLTVAFKRALHWMLVEWNGKNHIRYLPTVVSQVGSWFVIPRLCLFDYVSLFSISVSSCRFACAISTQCYVLMQSVDAGSISQIPTCRY